MIHDGFQQKIIYLMSVEKIIIFKIIYFFIKMLIEIHFFSLLFTEKIRSKHDSENFG